MSLPFRVAEIDHLVLRCRDMARAIDFYTRILGLTEEHRVAELGLVQLRCGSGLLDLIPAAERVEAGRNLEHFCLGVEAEDIEAVLRYLRDHGVEVVEGLAERYGARGRGLSAYIRDPEGNVVELKQLPLRR
jgi:catechol 2,3-dioxygenase-like lactoylglutathione lyase family enzyme